MKRLTLARAAVIGLLAAAFPLAPALSVTTPVATIGQNAVNALKTKGAAEIDRRIQNLNRALDKLSKSTMLSDADKVSLTKQVNDEVAGLTALKTKLAAETTLTAARADVQSIVQDYRVYALMLPKARMTASADRFKVVEDKLAALETKLQDKVTAVKTAGKDTAAMQKSLDEMKAKIDDAKAKSGSVVSQLLALQPTDYNQNHAVLVGYRASLKTAHDDLVAARDDAKSIIDSLKTAK